MKVIAVAAALFATVFAAPFDGDVTTEPLPTTTDVPVPTTTTTSVISIPTGGATGILNTCGSSSDAFIPEKIVLNPYPVYRGGNLTVYATGNLLKTVSQGAYVEVTVKAGFIQVAKEKLDLCQLGADNGYNCPVAPGPQTLVVSRYIQTSYPAATVNVKAVLVNADGGSIGCLSGNVKIQ